MTQSRKTKVRRGAIITLTFLLILVGFSSTVHAAGLSEFTNNLIPDSITKSLQTMQLFFYDFMSFVLDLFTIILFVLWIVCIIGIIYSILWLISLPKKIGAENFQDMMVTLASRLWRFMK